MSYIPLDKAIERFREYLSGYEINKPIKTICYPIGVAYGLGKLQEVVYEDFRCSIENRDDMVLLIVEGKRKLLPQELEYVEKTEKESYEYKRKQYEALKKEFT